MLFSDTSFFMLAVGINQGETVPPISTPEVYVNQPICVSVKLGCMFCRPTTDYTVQVDAEVMSMNVRLSQCNVLWHLKILFSCS